MFSLRTPSGWLLIVAVLCFGAVGAALVSQYQFDMQPCVWCVFQRAIFLAVGIVALVAAVLPGLVQRIAALIAMVFAGGGMAAALWQHFVASKSDSCAMTFADRVMGDLGLFSLAPDIFTPQASCADAAVNLFGLPYEFWSLGLFVIAALLCLRAALMSRPS
jgi:disulfide bond formation protein DsbB